MNQIHKTKKEGFTLPEVLVSVSVLVVVIFAITNLVVSIIRTNSENIHTLTAYGLAQEGLEAVRNIRDSNWLLGARYSGKLGGLQQDVWGSSLPDVQGESAYYIVKYGVFERSPNNPGIGEISGVAPWRLEKINDEDDDKALLYRTELPSTTQNGVAEIRYEHADGPVSNVDPTIYKRSIFIENISPSSDFEIMRVASVVKWKEQSRDKEVRLVTELTDWNQGQL